MLVPVVLLVCGCSNETTPPPIDSSQTPPIKSSSSAVPRQQHPTQNNKTIINLSKLWGASKREVIRALRGHKLIERDPIEKDYPDKMIAGGEMKVYDMGNETELIVSFNSLGYAIIASLDNQKENSIGLGFTFDQWQDLFHKYGLPDCGEPAKVAPAGRYWGPPHNKTGGFEIALIAYETGTIWQVQVRSPEDFFP